METKLSDSPSEAAEILKGGGLVAFPTETVYGLGANVFDEAAIAKIFEAKQRPADNPLIAHVSSIDQIHELVTEITANARVLIERFFPGPLTIVLKKNDSVPDVATADLDSIGIRLPKPEFTQNFLNACGVPVVAPSANLSGRPSPTTWQAVYEDLNGRIDCILKGNPTEIGLESTVVDCRGNSPIVLRQGAISIEQLRLFIPETELFGDDSTIELPSPGLRHKHYSPKADVTLVDGIILDAPQRHAAYIGLDTTIDTDYLGLSRICSSVEGYAHSLFEFFRECDRAGITVIYCEEVPEEGIGSALMDRLRRAAKP
jgi:L-threonylcarbamoyladenylate synthase